jgi:hypothetical protein
MDLGFGAVVLGGIQGQAGSIIKSYFDLKKHKIDAKYKAVQDVRGVRNKPFVFLQSVCCVLVILYVFLYPFFCSYTGIPIDHAYIESNGFFSALFSGNENVKWSEVRGYPIGPVHIYLSSAVIFYLCGNKGR